jgi:hypothetical protein
MTNAERVAAARRRAAERTCEVVGCDHPQDRCSGRLRMCAAHFQRVVRAGSARALTPVRRYERTGLYARRTADLEDLPRASHPGEER